jgi:hypothetical protein
MAIATPRPGIRAGTAAARTRARLADAHKRRDTAAIAALEAQLIEDIAADYIDRLLTIAPPLSHEARTRLASLFGGGYAAT